MAKINPSAPEDAEAGLKPTRPSAKRAVSLNALKEQAEGLRFNPGLMLIDDADKPAKWYFALKQARLKGTGEHPLSGPVTLHWRS